VSKGEISQGVLNEYEFLRDYLYLDVDKVKSIAGQLDFGIPEEVRESSGRIRRGAIGWDKVLSLGAEKSQESYIQRSVLDSLFPELEAVLEDGWLIDVSDEFSEGGLNLSRIKELRPEGSLFRLTAEGFIFNPEQFLQTMTKFSSLLGGLEMLQSLTVSSDIGASNPKKKGVPNAKLPTSESYRSLPASPVAEDFVECFRETAGASPEFLRSMIRMVRGFSSPGTTLYLESGDNEGAITLSSRFQQNRRYFDADADLIAAQYGLSRQRWTIVGTIGHYTRPLTEVQVVTELTNARGTLDAEGNFTRRYLIGMMSNVIQHFGAIGVSDIPQHPGISAIPMAVYRTFARA
jgi:hypothetical protein